MKDRRPVFNFDQFTPHWSGTLEFSHFGNAASVNLAFVEPFLNRVLNAAKTQVSDTTLQRNIEMFITQEGNHYKAHKHFNTALRRNYPGLSFLERRCKETYEHLFKESSLRFLCAYCCGFETLGPIVAGIWLDELGEYSEGADDAVLDLWRWHYAEEFEHRSVCYDVYSRLFGSYLYRIYGLYLARKHLGRLDGDVFAYLLKVDRAGMTPAQRKRSIQSERTLRRWWNAKMYVGLLKAISPFYDPAKIRPPKYLDSALRIGERS